MTNIRKSGDTYVIFSRIWYFFFFVYKATGYALVRFLKNKSEDFGVIEALITLLKW